MNIQEILGHDQIDPDLVADSSVQAIQSLVHRLVETGRLEAEHETDAILALLKREANDGTNFGNGVAIPHARVPFVKDFIGALGVLSEPIEFVGAVRTPVQIVFLLLSPDWDAEGHLRLMSEISRLASDQTLQERLSAAASAEQIHDRLSR